MPALQTFSQVSTLDRANDTLDVSGISVFSPVTTFGLANAFCGCNVCCDLICELDLGTISFESAEWGSASFAAETGWLGNNSDTPDELKYRAWIEKTSDGPDCDAVIRVVFGGAPFSVPVEHPDWPLSFYYGPTWLDVNAGGSGTALVNRSGSGTSAIGEAIRPDIGKGSAIGIYVGEAEIPNPDGSGDPATVTDGVTVTVALQASLLCLDDTTGTPTESWDA